MAEGDALYDMRARQKAQHDRMLALDRRDAEREREVGELSRDVNELRTQVAALVVEMRFMTEAWKALRTAALYVAGGIVLAAILVAFGVSGGAPH